MNCVPCYINGDGHEEPAAVVWEGTSLCWSHFIDSWKLMIGERDG